MFSSSSKSIATLTLASLSLAQTSTVNLYIPGADTQSLIGEIVGTASSLTTYALQCVNPGEECGFRGQFTITENAATARYTMPAENGDDGVLAFTARIDCSLDSTVSAVCVESFGGSDANFPGQSTETYTGTDFQYMPVFLTAGAAVGTGSTAASTTTSAGRSSQTSTSTSSARSGVAQTGASSTGTSTSTAGAPVLTGNAQFVLGGVAAVGAMALMG
ncbi:putative GPI anchored protein [Cadophora sp. MPI-SDFR-AT-0126]|nr:putative GPI anchored protein [Leotiomycetes sp. MPI-SDFR-AT-0126]